MNRFNYILPISKVSCNNRCVLFYKLSLFPYFPEDKIEQVKLLNHLKCNYFFAHFSVCLFLDFIYGRSNEVVSEVNNIGGLFCFSALVLCGTLHSGGST